MRLTDEQLQVLEGLDAERVRLEALAEEAAATHQAHLARMKRFQSESLASLKLPQGSRIARDGTIHPPNGK